MPVILATWEVEFRKTAATGQPGQKVRKTPSEQKKRLVW
jgi:hypothetical protein